MKRRWFGTLTLFLALFSGMAGGIGYAAAQGNATPASEVSVAHPSHIHSGTCEELGDVVHPLEDVTDAALSGTPVPGTAEPSEQGLPGDVIGRATTTVDASLDDLLAEDHAVNVHKSAEEIDVYVACANIDGEAEGGELILDLEQLDDSGINGQVILADVGEGQTEVTITLTDASAEGMATPQATPSS